VDKGFSQPSGGRVFLVQYDENLAQSPVLCFIPGRKLVMRPGAP
jgi:hypothetical protein